MGSAPSTPPAESSRLSPEMSDVAAIPSAMAAPSGAATAPATVPAVNPSTYLKPVLPLPMRDVAPGLSLTPVSQVLRQAVQYPLPGRAPATPRGGCSSTSDGIKEIGGLQA